MFRKALLTASIGAVLGMAAMMPTTALAQFGPPPGPLRVLVNPSAAPIEQALPTLSRLEP